MFTGRTLDILDNGSLKLQYNRNRYYDQYTGRWLTNDPLGMPNQLLLQKLQYFDGMNLYQYVHSNPVNARDPLGLLSLGGKIGFIFISRVLTPGPINWIRSNEYPLNDSEEEMIGHKHIATQMEHFYASLIKGKCQGKMNFKTTNALGNWTFSSTGLFSTGWWLNGAHRVSAEGDFTYCCQKRLWRLCKLTDVSVNWEWYDDIDAKGFGQAIKNYKKGVKEWGWLERIATGIGLTVEGLWDIFGDKIADTDFRVRIKWKETRNEPITIVGK